VVLAASDVTWISRFAASRAVADDTWLADMVAAGRIGWQYWIPDIHTDSHAVTWK